MTFADYGISVPSYATSQAKVICPKCSPNRQKKSDTCLSVNITDGVWNCHHCGWKGGLKNDKRTMNGIPYENTYENINNTVFKDPEVNKSELPSKVVEWFKGRGISEKVLIDEKIGYSKMGLSQGGWIEFPYIKDSNVVNIKYRSGDKGFRQTSQKNGAEKCFYRYDCLEDNAEYIICEGEMDALSLVEAGYDNVISVPDGAPSPNSKPSDLKFSYLKSAEKFLMDAKKIILAVDNDSAGEKLQSELSRRIGRERCYMVKYPDGCKDVNDVLTKHNIDGVKDCIESAKPYPIKGILSISDVWDSTLKLLDSPEDKGLTSGWSCLDDHYRVSKGETTVVTGVPNMGKSEWIDALMVNMIQHHLWNFAIFSAENRPVHYHLLKLMGKIAEKPFSGEDRMDSKTAERTLNLIKDNVIFLGLQEDDVTVDSILEQARVLNYRYGINGLIIDPWNTVEHNFSGSETETNYISKMLSKISAFAKRYEVHIWIVAHPKKMEVNTKGKITVPTLYDISGSANWYNKIDNGIIIHRHKDDMHDRVGVYSAKIRHQHKNGVPGLVNLKYNTTTGRYTEHERQPNEREISDGFTGEFMWD